VDPTQPTHQKLKNLDPTHGQLCRRRTARRDVSVKLLPTAAQQCRNELYDKRRTNQSNVELEGYSRPTCKPNCASNNNAVHRRMCNIKARPLTNVSPKKTGYKVQHRRSCGPENFRKFWRVIRAMSQCGTAIKWRHGGDFQKTAEDISVYLSWQ